ncbi:efflux RND transporter periplasmic adaptor subunit [Pseudolabrys taiwanensis]|uniref:Efflux RND transporter periplasmic adaptor subunit n=1 Tax=Pseudolabrys taiwanensis TaxID=331696 RepID=A0A345ZXK0_9HYPH|nr:efflux RND transporter periplasmic adaptor subunit [Pseudolabrys taiwanensis]
MWALIGLLIVLAYPAWHFLPAHGSVTPQAGPTTRTPAVPVTTQVVQQSDFPVYLNGLGTVQPYDTVTVRSRVDGQVIKVAFRQGQMVKEGDLLVQIDPRPYQAALDQAQAKKAQDEANLRNAELDLERFSTLAKSDFASRQQLDTQQAMVNQLTAQIKGDQAAIDNAQTQLDYTAIRSPLSGKTGFRQVDPGNIVHAADTTGIVSIVKLQPISVVFTAPEEDLQRINQALADGTVPVTALSSDSSRTLAQGHLALVNNQIDQASGTIQMKATFTNENNALWPGLSVATRLLINTRKNVVVTPNDAIQHGPNGLYAFVVGADNKVSVRNITVGDEGSTHSVVTKGLAAGDRVVVAGQYRLTPGTLVDARAAGGQTAPANEQAENGERKVH